MFNVYNLFRWFIDKHNWLAYSERSNARTRKKIENKNTVTKKKNTTQKKKNQNSKTNDETRHVQTNDLLCPVLVLSLR